MDLKDWEVHFLHIFHVHFYSAALAETRTGD